MAPLHEPDVRLDLLGGVLLAVFFVTTTPLALDPAELSWASYPLCAIAGLAFVLRRRAPLVTLAIAVASICVYTSVNGDGGPIFGAAFLALAWLGNVRPETSQWLPATLVAVGVLVIGDLIAMGPAFHMVLLGLLLVALPRITADRARTQMLRESAIEQEGARRLVEERLRIAREVHDVVGHGLAAIALRAGVADRVIDRDPGEAQAALRAIRSTARDSLSELGALLGVLRAESDRSPVPDLDELPRLVDGLRQAGLAVDLVVRGEPAAVPDVVGAASYRIVQEALTNVARHAGDGARAQVRLVRGDGAVEVEVVDDGRGAPVPLRDRGGLSGMRERAAALGGTFEAGTAPGGGFRVRASLPAATR